MVGSSTAVRAHDGLVTFGEPGSKDLKPDVEPASNFQPCGPMSDSEAPSLEGSLLFQSRQLEIKRSHPRAREGHRRQQAPSCLHLFYDSVSSSVRWAAQPIHAAVRGTE